ncbi:MAG: carbohydrate porin [Bacteroidales bacterium]
MIKLSHVFCKGFLNIFFISLPISLSVNSVCISQDTGDSSSVRIQKWNVHFQNTEILQFHPSFRSPYAGKNSLNPGCELTLSSTSTLFFGFKVWKNGDIYLNPEISAGKGFSGTVGVAGFPNGEVYRVSSPELHFTPARFYIRQIFPLSADFGYSENNLNQLAEKIPDSYISLILGKFSIMDFFDDNTYSHDPRKDFFNWALMGNGAWDYPADTMGYTYGLIAELIKPAWALRFSYVMVPKTANGSDFDTDIKRSNSEALEFEKRVSFLKMPGTIHVLAFCNIAMMGSYPEALEWGKIHNEAPAIDSVHRAGNTKFGFGINIEQPLNKTTGFFIRAGWNDGNEESWMFTEIDRTISGGLHLEGKVLKKYDFESGVAIIINGLSEEHKEYLSAGGYGFIIGDGRLNYGPECIMEVYYSQRIRVAALWISPDYQLIVNPAYNRDRGPVNAIGLRIHFEL